MQKLDPQDRRQISRYCCRKYRINWKPYFRKFSQKAESILTLWKKLWVNTSTVERNDTVSPGTARARLAGLPKHLQPALYAPCPEESVNWDTTQNLFIEGWQSRSPQTAAEVLLQKSEDDLPSIHLIIQVTTSSYPDDFRGQHQKLSGTYWSGG